jgi:hypothetical protein
MLIENINGGQQLVTSDGTPQKAAGCRAGYCGSQGLKAMKISQQEY